MGAAASLILILKSLIQKLPDTASGDFQEKKELGLSQGYRELPHCTVETVHYLPRHIYFFCGSPAYKFSHLISKIVQEVLRFSQQTEHRAWGFAT